MQFEWDDNKNSSNIQKNGIDFLTAVAIFDDPNRLEEDCTEREYGEIRTKTIGRVGFLRLFIRAESNTHGLFQREKRLRRNENT